MRTPTMPLVLALPIALALLLASCATRGGAPQPGEDEKSELPVSPHIFVDIDSEPIGALVSLDGIRLGRTPLRARIETREDGSTNNPTRITADFSTNPRTPNATEIGLLEVGNGDFLPRRLKFLWVGVNVPVQLEATGRAITDERK